MHRAASKLPLKSGTKRRTPPPMRWQLQNAKARFSQVVNDTLDKGPQIITRHGRDIAAVIPIEDLPKVLAPAKDADRRGSILEMLRRCPSPLTELDLVRDKTPISAKSVFHE